ncbi:DUF397 domain-containing protein [Paractinoplanes atraurantiacus]|uniref:DUF397 domain-containing protein n=1 Tax=Paractinoplanes atraurantiacus TaxID=1036182 RepID=A0A285JX56_9ACTN|nr:DUF397 domain-containing protein [Actinoplanes atraurantiacus]SNY64367.1 protein of unknown function [Actinoplanes atraurantiacus]
MSDETHAALSWHKSTRSGGDNCVLVATTADQVYLRDSKDPQQETLHFGTAGWKDFLDGVRAGEFDR